MEAVARVEAEAEWVQRKAEAEARREEAEHARDTAQAREGRALARAARAEAETQAVRPTMKAEADKLQLLLTHSEHLFLQFY